jgi:predicted nucleotidyltransferase
MISVQEAFLKFKSKLELTKTESADAQKRHNEVRSCIRQDFEVERDFLTGSYGRHTKTKPLKDIDIFFVLKESEAWRRDEPPTKTLDAFERCLKSKYDHVESNRRCITVEFDKAYQTQEDGGKVLSVDAVPAFANGSGYVIPDRVLDEWVKTDPEIHAKQATEKNKHLGSSWKPTVKMLKKWNAHAGKPIKPSFLIEVMAHDIIDPPYSSYADEVMNFFSSAQARIFEDWADPAGMGPPVSDQMDSQRRAEAKRIMREAEKIADRAMRAEELGNTAEALGLWRELFGPYFPVR